MGLLLVDIDHFIAFGAFFYVSEAVGLMKVDFVYRELFPTVVACSLLLFVFHF